MEGIEIGKTYRICRPKQSGAVFSLQYNFKPPINESVVGSAIVKSEEMGEESGDSGATWEVRLPAAELPGASKSSCENLCPSHKELSSGGILGQSFTNKGKKRVIDESEEEEDKVVDKGIGTGKGSSRKTQKEEVFSGVSAPNKYEFLLTWDTETLPESRELVLEKVSSLVRLQHKAFEQHDTVVADLVKSGIEANKKLKTLGKPLMR